MSKQSHLKIGGMFAAVFVLFGCMTPISAAPSTKQFALKNDEELDLNLSTALEGKSLIRVSNDSLFIELPQHHMILIAKAPDWSVQAVAPPRKLTGNCSLQEFVRRGSPLNFLKVTAVPEWPLVAQGKKEFHGWDANAYALPYKTRGGAIVPPQRGRVGDMIVLGEGVVPKQACQIIATLIQTPKVNGLPVKLDLWDTDPSTVKVNSVFLFSGGKRSGPKEVETREISVVKRKPLPVFKGFTVCKDPRDVWVSNADTEGFEGLLH